MPKNHRFLSILADRPSAGMREGEISALPARARGVQGLRVADVSALQALANEAPADRVAITGLTNELTAAGAEGWACIPYGEWPHEQGLQRFGRTEAEEMVGYFKNTWNRIKRAIVGMPIYRGHPDLATQADRYPDKATYGQISDLEARDDGLYLRPVLSTAGAALVNEQGLKFFSPHWLAKRLPEEGGRAVFAPALLVSIGLTDRPNIAGTSLVNSAPGGAAENQPERNTTMPQWLIELLGLANEAPAEQENKARARLTELLKRPEAQALANEQSARATAETQLTELKTKLATAETALANERTARAEALVAAAVADGRITEAQKPVWLGRLTRDFSAESAALANERPAVKTTPRTAALGARKATSGAAEEFHALVNERVAKGEAWSAAWQAVKATTKGKALFEQMSAATAATS